MNKIFRNYQFIAPTHEEIPKITIETIKLYQICAFPTPDSGKFEIREVIINGDDNIVSYKIHRITEKEQRKMLKLLRGNKYRLYSTHILDNIGLPSYNDIYFARSGMINSDSSYTGFAEFNNLSINL